MEDNLNEAVYVEFIGLPGCGKSTVSHLVAEMLREKGYLVIEPSYEMDHCLSPVCRKMKKCLNVVCFFCGHSVEFFRVRRMISENAGKGYLRHMANIISKLKLYLDNKKAIFIWDEGILQSVVSLSMNEIDVLKIAKELLGEKKLISVYIETDIITALKRMAERETNDSRVEKENDISKKYAMMLAYKKNMESFITDIKIESRKAEDDAKKIVDFVMDEVF